MASLCIVKLAYCTPYASIVKSTGAFASADLIIADEDESIEIIEPAMNETANITPMKA
jgi:hypothetical protein